MTRVSLEYRYEGEDYGSGKLFPVWSFYGTVDEGRTTEGKPTEDWPAEEQLLLCIGAQDGTIY